MDEYDLITTLQSHLDNRLSVPVRAAGMEDERPVPLVLIDDWDTRDKNFHNSPRAGEATGDFDGDGTIDHEWYLNFDFTTRVEILCRTADEVKTSQLKGQVKRLLRLIRANPLGFHGEMKSCRLGSDGNPTHKFTEPKESELSVSARFHGDHTITRTASDTENNTIEAITENFTFNP